MRLLLSLFLYVTSLMAFFVCVSTYVLVMSIFGPYKTLWWRSTLSRMIILADGQWLIVEGKLPETDMACLYLSNHQSLLDVFVFGVAMPARVTAVAAEEYFQMFIWGFPWGILMRRYGIIPIKRGIHNQAMDSMVLAAEAIRQGTPLVMCPEGTRTPDGKVQRFKKGAFYLALQTRPVIVPLAIIGAYEARNRRSWLIRPGIIRLRFGEPMEPREYEHLDAGELAEVVRSKVIALM